MENIVITNVYGYRNIGDGAILDMAIKMINKEISNKMIHIHTATHFSKKINSNTKQYMHPYGIAIKTSTKPISDATKSFRFITIVFRSLFFALLGKVFPSILPRIGEYSYIRSLKEADMVLGIGGGYLRTKNKYKDYFGLLLTLLPILIAHLYNKRILYLPMSYGNFASIVHEKLVFYLIKSDRIIFRDEISLKEFSKHTDEKLDTYLIPDLVTFDEYTNHTEKKDFIVLTARLWMNELKQKNYERDLALFIEYVWKEYKYKTIFIPMVWNEYEDDDNKVGKRIKKLVKTKKIFKITSTHNSRQVKKLLSHAKIAICTRMHSAILATIVKTPFITIAYEHKTIGYLKHLELEKWNIDIEDFSFKLIQEKFDDLVKNNYKQFKLQLDRKHISLKEKESELTNIIRTFRSIN